MNIQLIFLIIKTWWTYYFKHLTRFLEILLRIILLELWIGERYFTFWKLVLLPDSFTIQTMLSTNIKTELYPVKANQNGSAWHIFWCNVSAYKWMGSHLRFFPVPISIRSSWESKLKKWHRANAKHMCPLLQSTTL